MFSRYINFVTRKKFLAEVNLEKKLEIDTFEKVSLYCIILFIEAWKQSEIIEELF